jgi:hypothetical protein
MLNDMAITGKDDQEHLQNLDKVLATGSEAIPNGILLYQYSSL